MVSTAFVHCCKLLIPALVLLLVTVLAPATPMTATPPEPAETAFLPITPPGCISVTETMIDDFEGPAAPAPWVFYDGGGFGAAGSLTLGQGHVGHGAHLAYDFTGGGACVGAELYLAAPLSAPAIAFWVRSPADVFIGFRVLDGSGQWLQYNLTRPFGDQDPAAWYRQAVELDAPLYHWGGADDGVIHRGIRGLAILVNALEAGLVGAIDFDEVTAVDPLVFCLDPATQPAVPVPPDSRDLFSRLGVNVHFTQDDQALDAARSAGFTWVRMDLTWAQVERTPGVYDFSPWDQLLASLEVRGMKALFILCYGNSLYTGDARTPPTTAAQIQAFGNYAEAAARHFAGHGVRYEVWNEPNSSAFWPPAPDPAQYAALAQETVARVHRGDPSAHVSVVGMAFFDFPFLRGVLQAGGATGADAIGVHPYLVAPEGAADPLLLMRAIVSQTLPANPPIWVTEWGYTATDPFYGTTPETRQRQACLVARELLSTWALRFPLVIYYDIRDGPNPNDREHNFGLLANDYTDKPAMRAVRTLTAIARGRTLAGFIRAAPTSLHALKLAGSSDVVVALWSSAPGGQVEVIVPAPTTAVDVFGAALTLAPVAGGLKVTIREADGPVYLTFPHAMSRIYLPVVLRNHTP